ncbi:MAG: ABC transporter permease subunit [Leptolyngbyaceae bacterium]|nr:ABC transporter permease subunit [Leptolyngbyaceae bacterium]
MRQSPPRPSWLNASSVWGVLLVGAIALSFSQTGLLTRPWLNLDGWPLLWRFLAASGQPDVSPAMLHLTLNATLITFSYAVCGTALSVVLGLVGGILASEVWWLAVFPHQAGRRAYLWVGVRSLLAIPRAIHEMIWGLFFVNIWGLDPLTGVVAIAIPFGAITAKVFSEILDETPRQPLMALLNSGVSPLTALVYSLLPQARLNLLSYVFYRFECSIRSAAVLGIIGAGGLGYQMLLSLQSLRYSQLWTLIAALVVLNGLVDLSSALLRRRLGCTSRLALNQLKLKRSPLTPLKKGGTGKAPLFKGDRVLRDGIDQFGLSYCRQPTRQHDPILSGLGLGLMGLIPWCFWYVGADFSKLWSPRTLQLLGDVAQSAFPPDMSGTPPLQLISLSAQTLAMSILAIAGAGLGGILLSFPATHNFLLPGGLLNPGQGNRLSRVWAWGILLLTRGFLLICRAIPAPIWALVFLFVLFPGILPGAVALGLHNLGILGRLMAEVTENLDQRPLEALKAQGTPGSLIFLYGVLPMTLPQFLAYILYRWEVCMRETVIVGLVGAGGLGRLLTEQLSSFDYQGVVVTLVCLIVLTFLVDTISGAVRRSRPSAS